LIGRFAFLLGAAAVVSGCDTGGLLVVDGNSSGNPPPPVKARSANELVNGGTFASNGKYKVFYTLGQPTPMQGVATSPEHRVNGGLAGAVQSK
jgi:hypothetical protein